MNVKKVMASALALCAFALPARAAIDILAIKPDGFARGERADFGHRRPQGRRDGTHREYGLLGACRAHERGNNDIRVKSESRALTFQ